MFLNAYKLFKTNEMLAYEINTAIDCTNQEIFLPKHVFGSG